MDISSETLTDLIPHYLPRANKETLIEEIKNFPDLGNYALEKKAPDVLQGDIWKGLTVIDFSSGDRRDIKGIILSNTCDISFDNERKLPVKVTFAPVIKVSSLVNLLRSEKIPEEKIDGFVSSIKKQIVSNYFYIPSNSKIEDEYVANLADLHSVPMDYFLNSTGKENILSLSQSAFYFFIFKLSIHFCRFNESVNRYLYA